MTIAIHKNVLFTRVTMKINEEEDIPFIRCPLDQPFGGEHYGVDVFLWVHPVSVEVYSGKRTPGVAIDYTVWI